MRILLLCCCVMAVAFAAGPPPVVFNISTGFGTHPFIEALATQSYPPVEGHNSSIARVALVVGPKVSLWRYSAKTVCGCPAQSACDFVDLRMRATLQGRLTSTVGLVGCGTSDPGYFVHFANPAAPRQTVNVTARSGEVCAGEAEPRPLSSGTNIFSFDAILSLFSVRDGGPASAFTLCCDAFRGGALFQSSRASFFATGADLLASLSPIVRVVWVSLMPITVETPLLPLPTFRASHVVVCGHEVSSTVADDGDLLASGTLVVVDFAQFAVTFPAEIFDAITLWANITCEGVDDAPRICTAPQSGTAPLPAVQIVVDGSVIEVPFESLVVQDPQRPSRSIIAIERGPSVIDNIAKLEEEYSALRGSGAILPSQQSSPSDEVTSGSTSIAAVASGLTEAANARVPRVVLGSAVLNALTTIIIDGAQLGFVTSGLYRPGADASPSSPTPTNWNHSSSSQRCIAARRCKDSDIFVEQRNACVDPRCPLLLTKNYDAATNTCSDNSSVITILVVMILAVIIGEVVIHLRNRTLTAHVVDMKKKNV